MALDIVAGLTASQEGINRLKPAAEPLLTRLFRLLPDRELSRMVGGGGKAGDGADDSGGDAGGGGVDLRRKCLLGARCASQRGERAVAAGRARQRHMNSPRPP